MLSEDISEGARELFLTHNPGAQTFVTTVIKVSFFKKITHLIVSVNTFWLL